jgi:hypothetical protein
VDRTEDEFTTMRTENGMRRWSLASMIVGMGIACGAFAPAAAVAGDAPDKETQAKASQGREAGEENPEKRVDKAIQSYESRADQDLEQTRKDIDRLQKELTELIDLQFTLAVSLAELQAEMKADAVIDNGADASSNGTDSGKEGTADQARQRRRTIELTRELRQLQDNLRAVVQQKRNETDQFVAQMRNLRSQQRQAAAERERIKQAASQQQGNPRSRD